MPSQSADLAFVGGPPSYSKPNCANFADVAAVDEDARKILAASSRSVPCKTGYLACIKPAYNSFGFLGTNSTSAAIQGKTSQFFGTYTTSATPGKPDFCQYDDLDKSTYLNDVGAFNSQSQGYFTGDTAPEEQHWGCGCFHAPENDKTKQSCCIDGDRRACPTGFDPDESSCDSVKKAFCADPQNKYTTRCQCFKPMPKGQFSSDLNVPRKCWDPQCFQNDSALKTTDDKTPCVLSNCEQQTFVRNQGNDNLVNVSGQLSCPVNVTVNTNTSGGTGDSSSATCTGQGCPPVASSGSGSGGNASSSSGKDSNSSGDTAVVAGGHLPAYISDKLFPGAGSSGSGSGITDSGNKGGGGGATSSDNSQQLWLAGIVGFTVLGAVVLIATR